MLEEQKNIIEPLAIEFLNNALMLRYDICTCQICKDGMLSLILSKVTLEQQTVMPPEKAKYRREIAHAGLSAIEIVSKNPSHRLSEDRERSFRALLEQIFQDRGLDFRQYHEGVIKRKIAVRMHSHSLESYRDYGRLLTKKPEEFDKLLEELCINVSEFFRDKEVWITVRYLLENLVKQKKLKGDTSLRIWSAGCANGEEPYSLAIMLHEILKLEAQPFGLELVATDIDRKALRTACAGVYPKENVKNAEGRYLKNYFVMLDNGNYQLKNEIMGMVKFQYLDLIRDDIIKETDLIICRNVFIYFNRSLQEQLLRKFYNSLKAGGYLVMGKAETLLGELKEIFKEIDLNARIYQK